MRFLIADDHAIVRKGLAGVLREEFPSAEVIEVGDAESLFKMALRGTWDLIISDLSMPGKSGLEILYDIKRHFPDIPVLILSIHPEELYGVRVLRAGASGYLNKDAPPPVLVKAIRWILQGRKYITPTIAEKLADDISFIAALIDTLSSRYRVDTRRVYATGISNGGILSYRLGCELAGRITAIAPVEAAYMVTGPCAPIRGVPALHIHSLQDSAIPYQGGPGVLSPGFSFPSVDSTIAAWRRAIGCTGEAETIASSALYTARRWSSCSGDAVVELYATSDGGHSWPGAGAMASAAFDATDVIWEFFSRFAMAPSSSVEDGSAGGELITVSPNPSHADAVATVMLERGAHVTLDLFDPLGRFVASLVDADLTDGAHAVSLPTLPRGAYLLRARIGGSVHTRGFVRE